MPSCSKAPRGLSVLVRVNGIFTAIAISPSPSLRQCPYRYAILDHDSIFSDDVIAFLEATGLNAKRTSIRAPWQNGTAERWIGSCRREILDHIIPVNEEHLRRILSEYVCYHQEDRVHDSLSKDTPSRRPVEPRSTTASCLTALPRLGGLHHRYMWREAA